MSRYTTELRWIVEQSLDDLNLSHDEQNWTQIWHQVGLADYPIFDESYRDVLNAKIVRHYYTREIAAETAGRWRMFVRDAMFLIMPYYNQLYESEIVAKQIKPLTDRGKTITEHATGESSTEGKTGTQDVFSDTPQSEMIPDQIKKMQYATNVTFADSDAASSSEYDNDVTREETGYGVSQSDLLKKYRETFLNIDREVVENRELRECFLTIW